MGGHGRVAGSASAIIGITQFALGTLAGTVVSVLHNGTALPMALVIAVSGVAGVLAQRVLAR
jgi:DHA1 family bicyclomycin/chloramphenicol resistance-like MFS transporter